MEDDVGDDDGVGGFLPRLLARGGDGDGWRVVFLLFFVFRLAAPDDVFLARLRFDWLVLIDWIPWSENESTSSYPLTSGERGD
jgi:hypothetical protein